MDEKIKEIRERWIPSDNLGIAHPILEDELQNDISFLFKTIEEKSKENVRIKREVENLHKALARKDKKIAQLEKELGHDS